MKLIDCIMNFLGFEKVVDASQRRRRWKRRRPRPKPTAPVAVNNKKIEYVLNDMSTPNLLKFMKPPVSASKNPKFVVKNYQGGGFKRGTEQSQAANCFITVANTLNFYRNFTDKPLGKWAGTSNLAVLPRAGQDLNAFYNRRTLSFFYFGHRAIGTVFTADSSDIVAHELGHAILDSYRPDTWGAASLEVWSFHEAFADLTAMMNIMTHREMLAHAINQTGGDMNKPNVISNLAEHVGKAIFKVADGARHGRNPNCLRSAINDFKYVNPGSLPKQAPANKLAAECHSFGRIFLGAFYDILVMMYEDLKVHGRNDQGKKVGPVDALAMARNQLLRYTLKAIQNAPLNVRFYESVAKTMLWADVQIGGKKYHDRMRDIFMDRNLMRPEFKMLSAPECDNDDCIMCVQSTMKLKLGDHMLRAQSDNPLYNVELEIPCDTVHLYDENHNLMDCVSCSDDEALMAAQDMITYLHETDSVDDTDKTPFAIEEGKLVRTHFER